MALFPSSWGCKEFRQFLTGLAGVLHRIDISFLWRPQLKDPADEMVLEAAVNGSCSHITSRAALPLAVRHTCGLLFDNATAVVAPGVHHANQ